ncbi:MAG TPA: polysaccharide deacetylase family protein, partial [Bacteroidia bacterium]|nr:polysaccharide deacetylase family protein [Bacteroidia bacterium]
LRELSKRNAKATFFCVGNNVKKNPEVYAQILAEGHEVGNHTFHHLNAWKNSNQDYYTDIELTEKIVASSLFRPPYGKIKLSQIKTLKKRFRIVMWDVLSKDYDKDLTAEDCLKRILRSARPGSIVVFHDSLKAENRLRLLLPKVLDHYQSLGYTFHSLAEFNTVQKSV